MLNNRKNKLKIFSLIAIFLFIGSNVFASDYALRFDGIDDYVNCGNDSSLNPTPAMSVEALIKLDAHNPDNWSKIIIRGNYDPYSLYVYDEVGYPNSAWFDIFVIPDELREAGTNDLISLDTWYHLVGTYDGTTIILYVNGVEKSLVVDTGIIATSSDDVIIGAVVKVGLNYGFNGLIDNVRIYNRALLEAEIISAYNGFKITNGLVGSWDFNEGEGNIAYDNSGLGNDGTIYGAIYELISELENPILVVSGTNITSLLAHVGTLVSDVSIVIWFAIGLPLGFWIIKKVISLI